MRETIQKVKRVLEEAERVVVFTGAGVSRSAGIRTFQETEEEWPYEYSRGEVFSIPFFKDEPLRFWEIYRKEYPAPGEGVDPTGFHKFCESLDEDKNLTVITQNTDGLHRASRLIELHGRADRVICVEECLWKHGGPTVCQLADFPDEIPLCPKCNHVLKPDISLFFEGINGFGSARDAVVSADLLIVAGTSLTIGPAHEIPQFLNWGREGGFASSIWVNPKHFPSSHWFEHSLLMGSDRFAELMS